MYLADVFLEDMIMSGADLGENRYVPSPGQVPKGPTPAEMRGMRRVKVARKKECMLLMTMMNE